MNICYGDFDKNLIQNCKNCKNKALEKKLVFGSGNLKPEILILMESPNKIDVSKGELLYGESGKLLNKILIAIGRKRLDDTYLTSILKYRPENNRYPLKSEFENCIIHLNNQIKFTNPELILFFGNNLAKLLLNEKREIDKIRLKVFNYKNKPVIITYHPNSLIKNKKLKNLVWRDFKFIKSVLNN